MRAWHLRRLVVVTAVFATAAVLGSCGGDDDSPAEPGPSVTKSIGAAGGSISTSDGAATLTVPPGALSASVDIKITEVLPENRTGQIKTLNADKVYRLAPSGLTFAVPATLTIDIAPSASGQVALAYLHNDGQWEAAESQRLSLLEDRRRMTLTVRHFSEAVVKTVGELTITRDVQPRSQVVGGFVVATETIERAATPWDVDGGSVNTDRLNYFSSNPFGPLTLVGWDDRQLDSFTLIAGRAQQVSGSATFRCNKPGTDKIYIYTPELRFPTHPFALLFTLIGTAFVSVDPISISVTCNAPTPEQERVGTGLFIMPAPAGGEALKSPDGIHVFNGPFAMISGTGPYALVTGENGAVVIDLTNNQVVMDMTSSGRDGRLGSGRLLGAIPISRPNPGPTTPAAFFASGQVGALRNFLRLPSGTYGWGDSQATTNPVVDVGSAGGGAVADEAVVATPFTGLYFLQYSDAAGTYEFTDEVVDASAFSGTVRGAVLPSDSAGGPVMVLTSASGDGSRSAVWIQLRDGKPATELFSIAGNDARQLGCSELSFAFGSPGDKLVCAVTQLGGKAHVFVHDRSRPTEKPVVYEVTVGQGAFGVDVDADADGNALVVVANFSGQTLSVVRLNDQGVPDTNETIPVPAGCVNPAHVSVFTDSGSTYVAGTCNGSGHYVVIKP